MASFLTAATPGWVTSTTCPTNQGRTRGDRGWGVGANPTGSSTVEGAVGKGGRWHVAQVLPTPKPWAVLNAASPARSTSHDNFNGDQNKEGPGTANRHGEAQKALAAPVGRVEGADGRQATHPKKDRGRGGHTGGDWRDLVTRAHTLQGVHGH